jgi:predicted NBD/HSP70 family sugar kinase
MVNQARAVAREDEASQLFQFSDDANGITIDMVCEAFDAGDTAVAKIVRDAGRYLGQAAANLIGVLSTRRILIAGSVACFGDTLLDTIRDEMARRSLGMVARETEVGISTIGPDIVILGASALVLTYELGLLAPPAGGMAQSKVRDAEST